MLAVANMEETVLFYQNVLGFALTMQSLGYSIVERDGQTIHFQKAASEEVMKCVRGHTEIYIEVSGIHSLWEHVKAFKNHYKIRDLFDREYGMTEFHIGDPNGCPGVCRRALIQMRLLPTSKTDPYRRASPRHS